MNDEMFEAFKKNFEEVFKALVPTGKSELEYVELVKKANSAVSERNAERKGIKISTSFDRELESATTDRHGVMMNLSPGQRTLISISIIIALQRCHPSPFYCFDEIDADLDSNHVKTLSSLIAAISKDSQVFLTTFRPETIENMKHSSIFKVEMDQSESVVGSATFEQARSFLARQ